VPRVSLNDGAKEVENGESWTFAAQTASCRLVYVLRSVSCAVTYWAIPRW